MKIRLNFVSNSSSSSYTCMISGLTQSGYDMCLSDAGMLSCINGHIFQTKYVCKGYDKWVEEEEEKEDGYVDEYEIPEEFCPICTLKYVLDGDIAAYVLYKLGQNKKEVVAEIQSNYKNLRELKKDL